MKIGIITDTHENRTTILRAIDEFNRRAVALVIHAGDMIAPFTALLFRDLKAPMKFHLGNNDGEILMLREKLLELGVEFHNYDFEFEADGKKFLVQHEPQNLEALAGSGVYDCIIYGHTHDRDIRRSADGRTLIVNPGECCQWLRGLSNIAIVDTVSMEAEVVELL